MISHRHPLLSLAVGFAYLIYYFVQGRKEEQTEAGKTVMAARAAAKDQEAPFPVWFYMSPAHR